MWRTRRAVATFLNGLDPVGEVVQNYFVRTCFNDP